MDIQPQLAKKAIEAHVKLNKIIEPPLDLPDKLSKNQSACFVSLHVKNGELRGCIGTILPTRKNLAQEIIYNAIAAATDDPRFAPVSVDELPDLEISVDVLSPPESIDDYEKLNPKKFGVIVKTDDGRTGLLLPDLEGVETAREQLDIAAQKGRINLKKDKFHLLRFTVQRYK